MFAKLVLLAGLFALTAAQSTPEEISVILNPQTNRFVVTATADENADAWGYYYKNYNASGWNYLDNHMQTEIDSVESHLNYAKAFGFLEGYVTCNEIKTFYPNFYSAVFGSSTPGAQTIAFVQSNYKWLQDMAEKNAATDDYWYTVKSILQQINGLYEGYVEGCVDKNYKAPEVADFSTLDNPTLDHFLLWNAWGDLYQITMKYREVGQNSRLQGNRKYKAEKKKLVERCSAIVKLLPNNADVVFGHNTWDSYESLGPRILKHYSFPLVRHGQAEHHYDTYFSSSPALLTSVDDWFTVSGYANLGVLETTNSLYNLKLLDQVVPESVLSWTRSITSNQMALNGADWATNFARYHSGTYTNQWMVLDYKLFTPGTPPPANFFTVFEEVPGLVHIEDQTSTLVKDTYWGSYNVPVYNDIADASGYAKACSRNPDECHETAPRAKIFRDNQASITSVEGAQWILSYNHYQVDTASQNDSCNTIACRGDLEPNTISAGGFGALDAKVSSVTLAKRNAGDDPIFYARLGPSHQDQPIFCWSQLKDESDYSHNGQPDCYPFNWQQFPPIAPAKKPLPKRRVAN